MKRLLRLPSLLRLTLLFLIALVFQNCSEQKIKESTDETLNITQYLRANPDYSMFLEILDITNYASFMNTYGTYTLFLPTNEAVQQYLNDVGATSLSQIPLVDLQNIAKLHILDQKVNTTLFTDGKITVPSMYGQYLLTGAANVNGASFITVNKTSNIIATNVELGNGVVHVIDKVLLVADKTLAQTIEADPNLSLFTEVLKATGWFDKLNKPITFDANNIGSYLTVLAQTNAVYDATKWKTPSGATITLNTLDNLKLRYSKPTDPLKPADPTNPVDSLNLYVQYHILPKLSYLADLATTPVFETNAPLEVISAKLVGDKIYLNRDVFNGVQEDGVGIVRPPSDVTCSNGVLHFVDGDFAIKKRVPLPVYFDLCDQPEFAANVANYRKSTGSSFRLGPPFANITWDGNKTQGYGMAWTPSAVNYNGDWLDVFRFRDGSGGVQNVTFTTPVIIKGRYKVWISYRQNGSASTATKVYFNDIQTSRLLNMREYATAPNGANPVGDRVLESQGYKRYIFPYTTNTVNSRLVGIVEVETTGRHKIKLNSQLPSSGNGNCYIDMIEFRPVDMDQLWPKFKAGYKTGIKDPNGDANGDGLIQREEATKGDNGNNGY